MGLAPVIPLRKGLSDAPTPDAAAHAPDLRSTVWRACFGTLVVLWGSSMLPLINAASASFGVLQASFGFAIILGWSTRLASLATASLGAGALAAGAVVGGAGASPGPSLAFEVGLLILALLFASQEP